MKSLTAIICLSLIIFPFSLWIDHLLNVIFNYDLVFYQIVIMFSALLLTLPEGLHGSPMFLCCVGQFYIWFIM